MRILTMVAMAALGCASAAGAQERAVEVDDFDAIGAFGQFSVEIVQGETAAVTISGDADDIEDVRIDVRRGELRLSQRGRGLFRRQVSLDVNIRVTAPALHTLEFGRGVSAYASGLEGERLEIEVSTGANVQLDGVCASVEYEVSTGGGLRARGLECAEVEVSASTGGSADIFAGESVDASASTGGDVDVYGHPAHTSISTSLGGDVSVR